MREDYKTGKTLSTLEWIEVLHDRELTNELNLSILQTLYGFEDHKASASQVGLILGFTGKNTSSPLNLEIGRFGKRVAEKYSIPFSKREDGTERKWDIFFDGWTENLKFIWKLKKELVEALEETGLTGDEQYPDEIPTDSSEKLIEGAKKLIIINSYERNRKARQKCIDHYGAICQVCDLNFENRYGKIGAGFIHVHHIKKVADIGESYEVDPINDLRPVCPNCHAMLHKGNPPLTIEQLKVQLI